MKLAHIRTHMVQTAKQHVHQEIELKRKAFFFELRQLRFEQVTRLWPEPRNLRQSELSVGECHTAGVDLVKDINRFAYVCPDRDGLLWELAILDPGYGVDIVVQPLELLHRQNLIRLCKQRLEIERTNLALQN